MSLFLKKLLDKYVGLILICLLTPLSFLLKNIVYANNDLNQFHKSITIIKILGGGSLFMSLPMLVNLKNKYPKMKLTLVTSDSIISYAELMRIFDEILIINTDNFFTLLTSSLKNLYKSFFTGAVIDLEVHSRLSSVYSLLTFSKNRIGFFSEKNKFKYTLLTHRIPFSDNNLLKSYYETAFKMFGVEAANKVFNSEHLLNQNNLTPFKSKSVIQTISIGPYCSTLCPEREFSSEEWILNLKKLDYKFLQKIIILGAKNDLHRSLEFEKNMKGWNPDIEIKNLVGKLSLKESIQEILLTDQFLTIDSGLNHIVRELDMNTISYWGPSDPSTRLDITNKKNETIIYNKLSCSPCVHLIDKPPCNGNNICMKQYNSKISLEQAIYYNSFIDR
jgi:ADP-heptose:LPS heptosyltransferase